LNKNKTAGFMKKSQNKRYKTMLTLIITIILLVVGIPTKFASKRKNLPKKIIGNEAWNGTFSSNHKTPEKQQL